MKSDSDEETLIRVLEWQHRNINCWDECNLLSYVIFWLFLILLTMSYFSISICRSNWLHLALASSIFLLWIYTSYDYTRRKAPDFRRRDIIFLFCPFRRFTLERILRYRIAVCKDYARLTIALLSSLFPNSRIYILRIPRHVAVGIELNSKIYVLNQKLPLMTLKSWARYWLHNNSRLRVDIYEFIRSADKTDIKKIKSEVFTNMEVPVVATKRIETELNSLLDAEECKTTIRLRDLALKWDDDEAVEKSIIRLILLEIDREFCKERVRVVQEGGDILIG